MNSSTSCRKQTLNLAISIITVALGSGSIVSSYAQNMRRTTATPPSVNNDAIRPFRVNVSEKALVDLRRRIAETGWPRQETVTDQSQGVQSATMRELISYWQTGYDWRKAEAKLNALPQFMTTIDGVDIHFIHVRSRHPNALPLIMTHGWPGSILECLGTIGPLTDPTAHGGRAEDGARESQSRWLVRRHRHWSAFTLNLLLTVPAEITRSINAGDPPPAGLSETEKAAYQQRKMRSLGYFIEQATRPQTIGFGLADSPVGLAAWLLDHDPHSYEQMAYAFDGHPEGGLTRDAILDNITLYWLTNTGASSARLYWEEARFVFKGDVTVRAAFTVFPGASYRAPRTWVEKTFTNLIYFNEVDKGGHFAAWEQPELMAQEVRAAFKSLR